MNINDLSTIRQETDKTQPMDSNPAVFSHVRGGQPLASEGDVGRLQHQPVNHPADGFAASLLLLGMVAPQI